MAEETAEVKEASSMGWVPKETFKGNPDHWVDAATYLERGRQVLPILQSNNQKLIAQLTSVTTRLSSMETSLAAANATIEALHSSHEEDVKEQVKAARKELKAELVKASRDGDHEAVAELTDKLTELGDAEKGKGEKPAPQKKFEIPADIQAWYTRNPEYTTNQRKIALANAVAAELRQNGDLTVGPAFMDKVAEEVEKELGDRSGASKVSGGNGGAARGSSGESSGSGKTYSDLPAEAKAACDKMSERLVGPNRAHKDVASWRKSYVEQFFRE